MTRVLHILCSLSLCLATSSVVCAVAAPRPLPSPTELSTPGFFIDFAAASIGHGLDDPARLPPDFRALWDAAILNENNANLPGTLDALHALEAAFSAAPHGLERLDAITRREKQESFAQWLALTHADLLASTLKTPSFDLHDVRDIERPILIGIFKERTAPALEPLKTYFPPIDDKTGRPGPFTPAQLTGITIANAIEVKHQALYASAILLAQITMEPDMPLVDRQLLRTQLLEVRRVLSTASGLEPAAKAAIAQAQRDKRVADLRALQDAARHPVNSSPTNNPAQSH